MGGRGPIRRAGAAARGAAAGAAAAAAWAAVDPLAARLLGTGHTDVRLLGRWVTRGRGWPAAGAALHAANGAALGAAMAAAGVRGPRGALAVAAAETLATWPGMALVDRRHPDRRDAGSPPLLTDGRVFAQEAAMHALWGVLAGLMLRRATGGR